MQIMTPEHPRWAEFREKLAGPDGCNWQGPPDPSWRCDGTWDRPISREILTNMGFTRVEVDASIAYFEAHGGKCDCTILLNVEAVARAREKHDDLA